jgi:hypothetical protein
MNRGTPYWLNVDAFKAVSHVLEDLQLHPNMHLNPPFDVFSKRDIYNYMNLLGCQSLTWTHGRSCPQWWTCRSETFLPLIYPGTITI